MSELDQGGSPWMTRDEAASFARVSSATLDRWVREGRLARYKIAGTQSVRFARSEITALVVPDVGEEADIPGPTVASPIAP